MAEASPHHAGKIYRDSVVKMQLAFTDRVLSERREMGPSKDGDFGDMTAAEAEKALRAPPNPNLQYFERAATEIGQAMMHDNAAALEWARSLSRLEISDLASVVTRMKVDLLGFQDHVPDSVSWKVRRS